MATIVDSNTATTIGSIDAYNSSTPPGTNPRYCAEIFTASETYVLISADLKASEKIASYGPAPGNAVLELQGVVANEPTGLALDTTSVVCTALNNNTVDWYNWVFTGAYELQSGTQYALVLKAPECDIPGEGYIAWGYTSDKVGKIGLYTDDGGTNWTDSSLDFNFRTYKVDAHAKATNPTPTDADTEVDFATPTLDWDGTGDTYTVWIGTSGGGFIASDIVATDIVASTYTLTTAQKAKFTGLTDVLYWRVNSTADGSELTGDTWTFDPRPGKATGPTPANAGSDISLTNDLEWSLGTNADTITVKITDPWTLEVTELLTASTDTSYAWSTDYLSWDGTYSWQVNSTNDYGTTNGTVWTFDSIALDHLRITYTLIDGGSGPYDGGVEGTDFWYNGSNNVITLKRLIVVSKDRMLYESL